MSRTLLRIGSVQKRMLSDLLYEHMGRNEQASRKNHIVKREYDIARQLYKSLTTPGRLCPSCGQRVKL
jgi:hypothetical protein